MMQLSESQLLYLLTIQELSDTHKIVQRIHIAIALGYSKASVTNAMQALQQRNLINMQGRAIFLTETGQQIVKEANQRYTCIHALLLEHQFSKAEADHYAKKLFYSMDDAFIERLWHIHHRVS